MVADKPRKFGQTNSRAAWSCPALFFVQRTCEEDDGTATNRLVNFNRVIPLFIFEL
jgi:hypothetical protein